MATLESNEHASIAIWTDGEPSTYALPAPIGDGADEVPQAVADRLVSIAQWPGEYVIVGEVAPPEPKEPKAPRKAKEPKAQEASAGDGAV